jgi:hypothetical protein
VLCYLYATGIGKFFLDIIAKSFLPPDRGKWSSVKRRGRGGESRGEERRGGESRVE